MKHRNSAREELLTEPKLLSDWAVQGAVVDAAIDVTDDDLVAAIELPEAIYRAVTARLDGRRIQPADVDLPNERASGAPHNTASSTMLRQNLVGSYPTCCRGRSTSRPRRSSSISQDGKASYRHQTNSSSSAVAFHDR